ncbi:DUF1553 domain-containing protein [Blastopirellula sp. JC732]|uniref:DUF1553 domain-containing protein n=1 Tax=Blastopirellula sediminis TaxID=2894196 RepID=A0A9X1MLC9_9BACT|nr:DUF1553 domain-containing protein [Blastopirellula sediminis]MCC9607559.1 DUF1553 domain-containing protein [Blastopirellula sediminis]MCC9629148.1 DUF1553 domain-containing protein [Blastopirellula sediminis]
MKCLPFLFTTLVALFLPSSLLPAAENEKPVDFEQEVAPLLSRRCVSCHSPNIKKGELSLASPDDLLTNGFVVPGDAAGSYLLEVVVPDGDKRPAMPKSGEVLSEAEVDLLRRWVEQGAVWPEGVVIHEASKADRSWWSLQPLAEAKLPAADEAPDAWKQNPIDRFVWAKLAEAQLKPNPPADRRTLIRRATFDLTGLPPTPEEVEAFLADNSPDAYPQLIERLLASPRYGERWGRHWLDVIRFGESRGFERNQIITNLWPFRDYVIRSINEDKPFDQFIREHLAGDVIAPNTPDVEIGAAFLVAGPYDDVGNQDPAQAAQIRANTIDEIIRSSSEAFLGLTVGCARCHDHKFDAITQKDYYGLYATFAGIKHGERPVATEAERKEREERLGDLQKQQADLTRQRDDIQKFAIARGDAKKEHYDQLWSRPAVSRQTTEERFAPVAAKMVRLIVEGQERNPSANNGYGIDEFEVWTAGDNSQNVALASSGATAVGDSRHAGDFDAAYSANLTIDGKFGARWLAAGPQLTITLAEPQSIDRVVFSSDRPGAAADHGVANFVSEYRILVSSDGEKWTEVANSHDRQPVNEAHRHKRLLAAELTDEDRANDAALAAKLAEVNKAISQVPPLPVWWVGTRDAAMGPFHLFVGGSPQRKGDAVTPCSLSGLSESAPTYELPADAAESQRRLELADWIIDPQNPLPQRVLANRLWQHHFGTGIVDTPNDFGYMGGAPSHPQLLDWLAGELVKDGWHIKPLHRQIMLSQAYQQSSDYREDAAKIDGDARLLWRFPPRRLSAEEVRDVILQISDKLNLEMGGPGFRLYQYLQDNVATYVPLDEHDASTYRRAVYHHNARAARTDLMTEFDSPDCAFSAPRRDETTTPLQALTMLNHDFTLDMSQFLAERLQKEAGDDPQKQIQRAYALCYGRAPTEAETKACVALAAEHGLPALCRALLNTSELIYLH